MSLQLIPIDGNNGNEISVKTDGRNNTIFIGRYEISMEDFLIVARYALTNTDIAVDDPRPEFIEDIHKLKLSKGFNGGETQRYEFGSEITGIPVGKLTAIAGEVKELFNYTTVWEVIDKLTKEWEGNESFLKDIEPYGIEQVEDWAITLHDSMGRDLRNSLKLWDNTMPLHKAFVQMGIKHPDEMSHHLLREIFIKSKTTKCQ